ncbi:MAG: AAA family ATPase, partial [Bacteroidaceae bacterium]|nr:AAA family ATPase [Bacteroidaceae bacterium]
MNSEDRIKDLEAQIAALPEGYISKKNIRGKETFYRQWKEDGKLKSKYIAREDLDYMIFAIKERKELQLLLEMEINRRDLASNPEVLYTYFRAFFLSRDVGIGVQLYEKLIEKKAFYVDKTKFILEWWNSVDDVTLITRPRRFGKTMTLSMVECFFSNRYAGRSDLFDTMEIWRSQRMRELQGTYPVISLSFGAIKFDKPEGIFTGFKNAIQHMIHKHKYHMSDLLDSHEKEKFDIYLSSSNIYELIDAIPFLCQTLYRVYGKKPIILIDEYDTPMLSAWTNGIWDDCSKYMRSLFNAAFKTNTCYTKVLITGISRISKESFFSDLNNLSVYSVSSDKYSTYFGFTEDEVVEALVHQKLDTFDEVKSWYDGFTFGNSTDIYNPWSITNYLASRKFEPYWAHSASNALLQQIFRGSGEYTKKLLEDLIAGKTITCKIKEDFTFSRIEDNLNDALSLLLCSGYLKIVNIDEDFKYEMKITNKEVEIIFNEMIE